MTSFRHLKSVIRLNELAEDPYDLTKDGAVTPKRIDAMTTEAAGFKLFYAMERISEITFSALSELADETQAVKKMADMQGGEIVNFIERHESENRPALHTAMRDFFEHRNTSDHAKEAAELAYKLYGIGSFS
jgi:glucose-6-phosphate isomerase